MDDYSASTVPLHESVYGQCKPSAERWLPCTRDSI